MAGNFKILQIKAREILDSRGNPTIEVDCITDYGTSRASVPSGASTGKHESLELRDNNSRFLGKGVQNAVDNVNKIIAPKLISRDCKQQREIDELMIGIDGTKNKAKLGANAILGVSLAVCKAASMNFEMPLYKYIAEIYENKKFILPVPAMNIINGGAHAGNQLDIQEYSIMPVGAKNFREAMQMGSEVYHTLKELLKKNYGTNSTNVGDEGGFAPPLNRVEDPLDLIEEAIKQRGYSKKIFTALDCAASQFFKNGLYVLNNKNFSAEELIDYYKTLTRSYSIISIEDPFAEEEFENFAMLKKELGKKIQIIGDDILVTNIERIKTAIENDSCSCLLLKVNQIGTLSEALDASKLAQNAGWNVQVSHRSGETEDNFIADLTVGIGNGQIKSGAPSRGERLAKYNQLLRIEEELGRNCGYQGRII
ncbi:MAG TPA: phosphopyruvate hydratase [Candidatus Nanoarchaeia archaeon]|nr:phosphopyruvate hydratase [Candidatus Nanoarchaeia archaeon]